jgi:hypothetical protein
MFTPQFKSSWALSSYAFRFALAASLALVAFSFAYAQGVGSSRNLPGTTGGRHIIKGRVIFPSGSTNQRVKVVLDSNTTGTLTTTTDADGAFIFNSLIPASYTITVDAGPEFEVARESVTIDAPVGGVEGGQVGLQSVNVPIVLRPKGSPAPANAFAGVPKQAIDFYNQALESEKKGDIKKAVEQLNSAITAHPNFVAALNELGVQYLKLGQPDKAADTLQKAVKLAPGDFYPHLNYGIALLNKKNFAEAETELREALKLNSNAPTAHMYLGVALLSTSRDPKTNQYDMAKYAESQKEFETAAASGKAEVAMAHKYLGGIYMGNKDYKRAADELELYLKLTPKAPDADKLKAIIKDLRSK